MRVVLSCIVAVVLAGISYGQSAGTSVPQAQVVFRIDGGVGQAADGSYVLLPSSTIGTIVVKAGNTIKFRFAKAATQGRGVFVLSTQRSGPLALAKVPCEGESEVRNALPSVPVVDMTMDTKLETLANWKGTCRLMTVSLQDRSTRRVRLRFE